MESRFADTPESEDSSFDEIVEQLAEGNQLIIFKASPRCFLSLMVEKSFDEWYQGKECDIIQLVKVNVVTQRALSNMIADRYKIVHESPQLIWLDHNEKVIWQGSHNSITAEVLDKVLNEQVK